MDWWKQALDAQAEAGCSYAVQASYPIGEKLDDIKLYCDYFNQVGAEAKKRGLRFGFHNHAKEFEKREGEVIYDYMVANTDPTNVMFELDVYWAQKDVYKRQPFCGSSGAGDGLFEHPPPSRSAKRLAAGRSICLLSLIHS